MSSLLASIRASRGGGLPRSEVDNPARFPHRKTASDLIGTIIYRMCSAEVWVLWKSSTIVIVAWMARSFERVCECFLPYIYPVLSKKWPFGICAALLRSLHCFGLVLAKRWDENSYLQCCQRETRHKPTHKGE
jgi:hypothetical protein